MFIICQLVTRQLVTRRSSLVTRHSSRVTRSSSVGSIQTRLRVSFVQLRCGSNLESQGFKLFKAFRIKSMEPTRRRFNIRGSVESAENLEHVLQTFERRREDLEAGRSAANATPENAFIPFSGRPFKLSMHVTSESTVGISVEAT